jgi:PBSX family phage terminase large subunit
MTYKQKEVKISDIIIPKYHKIFNATEYKHIILTSGRAGTKSSYAAIKATYQVVSDADASVVVLRKRHNKLRKTVYKEMLRGISRLGLSKRKFRAMKSPMEITYKANGSTIYFAGSDGIDDTKGIIDEDKPIKLVILDELTEFFDEGEGEDELANIEATFVRGNTGGFQMLYLYNPPKNPNAPINEWLTKMKSRPDCLHIHVDYRDVPEEWLGKDLIESARMMKLSDPKMYAWTWLGETIGIDDLIYYMFDAMKHVYSRESYSKESQETIGEIVIGVDYGQQNATVYEAFGIDYETGIFRGLDEYYHSGRESGKQKTPSDYAKDMKEFCDRLEKECKRVVSYIYVDPSARGLIEEFKRVMPHITIIGADNEVKLGISRVQKLLAFKKIKMSPAQKRLIKGFGVYQYCPKSIQRGEEKPLKENDHTTDALRYAVTGIWYRIRLLLPMTERGDES